MKNPELDAFVQTVAKMRELQTSYFKTRSPQALNEARKIERAVDRYIREYSERQHQRMFG